MDSKQQQDQIHPPQTVQINVEQAGAVEFVRALIRGIQEELGAGLNESVSSILTVQVQVKA